MACKSQGNDVGWCGRHCALVGLARCKPGRDIPSIAIALVPVPTIHGEDIWQLLLLLQLVNSHGDRFRTRCEVGRRGPWCVGWCCTCCEERSKFPRAKPCPRAMVIPGRRTDHSLLLNSAIQHLNPDGNPRSIDSRRRRLYQTAFLCAGLRSLPWKLGARRPARPTHSHLAIASSLSCPFSSLTVIIT